MEPFKINHQGDMDNFVATNSYSNLLEVFQKLPNGKGQIIHVIGASGIGKSVNRLK